jgi:hypothetical protein
MWKLRRSVVKESRLRHRDKFHLPRLRGSSLKAFIQLCEKRSLCAAISIRVHAMSQICRHRWMMSFVPKPIGTKKAVASSDYEK